ncbi:MAG: STAS domain-containing protein [Candidatus Riflebacteria bacterium]|nr:STAS domain-containing protein [Candidatus Riflebacteria bacterium]
MSLAIECQERENDVVVVDIKGEITFENSDILREKINELGEQGKNRIIIDLANLKYMSSAGMGVLVHGLKKTRTGKGDLRLVNLSAKMRRVFLITQFTHHFTVFQTLDEAVKSFQQNQQGG